MKSPSNSNSNSNSQSSTTSRSEDLLLLTIVYTGADTQENITNIRDVLKKNRLKGHRHKLFTIFQPFIIAIIFLLIYITFPVQLPGEIGNNYFLYYFIKLEWWSILSVYLFVETMDACIPTVPDNVYFLAYLCAFLGNPTIHVATVLLGLETIAIIPPFALSSSFVLAMAVYGVYAYNYAPRADKKEKKSILSVPLFDMYSSMLNLDPRNYRRVSNLDSIENPMTREKDEEDKEEEPDEAEIGKEKGEQQMEQFEIQEASVSDPSDSKKASAPSISWFHRLVRYIFPSSYANRSNYHDSFFKRCVLRFKERKLFPRWWRRNTSEPILLRDMREQWKLACWYGIIQIVPYGLSMHTPIGFTQRFAQVESSVQRSFWFTGFLICTTGVRVIAKRIGLELDRGKVSLCSMYFIAELMGLFFYFSFYRALFEKIYDWGIIFGISFLHLFTEWMIYVFRGSRFFYNMISSLSPSWYWFKHLFFPPNTGFREWQEFLTLDFGIRLTVMIPSAPIFLSVLLYDSIFPWPQTTLRQSLMEYGHTLGVSLIAVALEIINTWAMDQLYFKPNDLDFLAHVSQIYSNERFSFIACLVIANMAINPVATFDNTDDFSFS